MELSLSDTSFEIETKSGTVTVEGWELTAALTMKAEQLGMDANQALPIKDEAEVFRSIADGAGDLTDAQAWSASQRVLKEVLSWGNSPASSVSS